MLGKITSAWQVVTGLGTGGQIAAILVSLHLLALLFYLALTVWALVRRRNAPPPVVGQAHSLSPNAEAWKARYSAYLEELNISANPARRDGIEYFKESSVWARLGVQYALVVNAGAMAALPYLLAGTADGKGVVSMTAISSAAGWFATGLILAADCCLMSYANYQCHGERQFSEQFVHALGVQIRHFGDARLQEEYDRQIARVTPLMKGIYFTVFAAVFCGILAWVAFMWGTIQLIGATGTSLTRAASLTLESLA